MGDDPLPPRAPLPSDDRQANPVLPQSRRMMLGAWVLGLLALAAVVAVVLQLSELEEVARVARRVRPI
jgi:hypothetical protein